MPEKKTSTPFRQTLKVDAVAFGLMRDMRLAAEKKNITLRAYVLDVLRRATPSGAAK